MANEDSFYERLTRIFRSGPAIQRRVKGRDPGSFYNKKIIQGNYGYRAAAPMGFGRENSPFSTMGQYGILDRMARYCLTGDMRIAVNTPEGTISLKELVEYYEKNPDKKYSTFSYDKENEQIVCAPIKHAFYTKIDEIVEVHLDSGKIIRCTKEHPLMLRDGTYCEAKDLKPNMALMPFYRKDLEKYSRYNRNIYRSVYSFSEGWRGEHKIVAEYMNNKKILPEEHLHVHHKNHIGNDNRIENLEIMPAEEHLKLHANDAIHSSKRIGKRHHTILIKDEKRLNQIKSTKYNTGRSLQKKEIKYPNCKQPQFKNPNCDTSFTIETIKNNWENNITAQALAKKCGVHYGKFNTRLKWAGYKSYVDFVQKNFDPNYNKKYKKPRHLFDLPTIQDIYNNYNKETTCNKLAKKLNISPETLLKTLRRQGYLSWHDFTNKYKNHKVKKIVFTGKKEKVYDITVEPHHNFAVYDKTGKSSIISHNSEFSEMEYTPEIATGLNIYADEVVGGDDRGKAFHIYSDNPQIKKHLEELFYDVLNVDFNLRAWTRNLVKYGDFFLLLEVFPDVGVTNVIPIPVNELEREEGYDEEDPYAIRFKWLTRGNTYLNAWQVVHFRNIANDLFLPYGTSILEPARRVWRQLTTLEDAMLTYRVVRSPERRVFYIDVGNMAPNDIPSYMESAKAALNSRGLQDKETGREDMRFNSPTILDDYYIPVRGNQSNTKIEQLPGGQHATATEDVEYIQRKLFAAIQVPKPYLNFDENLSAKASLAQMDIRFSRTIAGFQKIMIAELNKLAMIHLFSLGFDGSDLVDFDLKLSNPSSVAMQQQLELWEAKFTVAGTAKDTGIVDEKWVHKNILQFTDEERAEIDKGKRLDKLKQIELEVLEPEPYDQHQSPNTVDPFDASNYDGPGFNVPKDKPKQDKEDIVLNNFRSYDSEGQPYVADLNTTTTPIKATPFMTRFRRNSKRRVGTGGRSNLALPDIKSMLSTKNKYTKDVYGLKTEHGNQNTEEEIDSDFKNAFKIEPKLTNEMNYILGNLKDYLHDKKKETDPKNMLLSESLDDSWEIELEDKDIVDEMLLEVNEKEFSEKNFDEEEESIKEKTLCEVFKDDE